MQQNISMIRIVEQVIIWVYCLEMFVVKKGDIIKLTFFTRSDGFKGGGYRTLLGRCLYLKTRNKWTVLHFRVIIKYIKFFFKIPLVYPLIFNIETILQKLHNIK